MNGSDEGEEKRWVQERSRRIKGLVVMKKAVK